MNLHINSNFTAKKYTMTDVHNKIQKIFAIYF